MTSQQPHHFPDNSCACAALRRAARSTTQLYELVLQPTGLKATQFIALRTIEQAGELEQWRFAQQQGIAVETLSRRFSVLRRRGLVSVRIGSNHGERIYTLTEEGRKVLAAALPYWERAQNRLARMLGDSGLQLLLEVCEAAASAAQNAEKLRAPNGTCNGVNEGRHKEDEIFEESPLSH